MHHNSCLVLHPTRWKPGQQFFRQNRFKICKGEEKCRILKVDSLDTTFFATHRDNVQVASLHGSMLWIDHFRSYSCSEIYDGMADV